MIDVAEHDLKTILNILNKHVKECEVRAFGSRVTWTDKDSSDLDLVIVCDEKLERGRIEKLREAFDESSIPFTVDVMDWHRIAHEFQKNIEKSFYVLKKAYKKVNSEWQYYKVSDFADVMSGGTPKTEVIEYWNGNIPWITPKDLSNYRAREISRGERNISPEGLKNSSARLVPPRTVLLTSRAPVGYLAVAKNELATNQGFKNLIAKNGFSPEFIYYLLLNNVDYLRLQASGSTFQELTASTLRNLEFLLPEYAIQEKIAKILGNIDDKIELLREQNKTLEKVAQAIYKRWFVDLEFPDEHSNPYKSSGGKMVESELGEIPEGWRVEKITQLFDFIKGVEPGADNYSKYKMSDNYIPFYRVQNISGNGNNNMPDIFIEKSLSYGKIFEEDDILVSLDGTIGKVFIGGSGSYSSGIRKVVGNKTEINQCLSYCFLKSDYFQNGLVLFSSGETTIKHAGKALENLKIAYSKDIFKKFSEITNPIFEKMVFNLKQIQTLSALRDSLLPRLMSGKIRVNGFGD